MENHWFDRLNLTLTQCSPRRGVLHATGAVLGGLLSGHARPARGKRKHKHHKKNRPGNRPRPNQSCSGGGCNEEFVLPDNREYCEFICRQCDADDDPRHFCIVDADPTDPDNPMKIAVCCEEGEVCCGGYCCPEGHACCDGNRCCQEGSTCCGDSCCGTHRPGTACCNGSCVITDRHHDHCGGCGIACRSNEICRDGHCQCDGSSPCECGNCDLPGMECCPGAGCIFVEGSDFRNCGGCGVTCPLGQPCINGHCTCGDGYKYCPLVAHCADERVNTVTCCGTRQPGYCYTPFPCCGEGEDASCSPYLTCP